MYIDRLALIVILVSIILTPSILQWVNQGGTLWYRPYLIGLMAIGINYWLLKRLTR